MKNIKAKKILSLILSGITLTGLLSISVPNTIEASAASGSWVLESEKVAVCAGYKSGSNSISQDLTYGNVNSTMTIGSTVAADGTYSRTNAYLGKINGYVRFVEKGGYIWKKPQTSDNYSECQAPNASYAPGEKVTLKVHTWEENVIGGGQSTEKWIGIDAPGLGHSSGRRLNFENTAGKTRIVQLGQPTTVSWIVPSTGNQIHVMSGKMGTDPAVGDKCTIYFMTDAGQYEWNYIFRAAPAVKAPKKASITSAKNSKSKAIVVKYKVSGSAKGYEISYTQNNKFKKATTKTTNKKTYTIKKLKKGKTYFVRVRAYNIRADGSKVFGKWSSVKKVTIKK
jgi:hypothetical protein